MAKTRMTLVAYKGGGPALTDVIGSSPAELETFRRAELSKDNRIQLD